jgi:undecaprenyl-diphosphatase
MAETGRADLGRRTPAAVAVAAAVVFLALAAGALGGGPLDGLDRQAAQWLAAHPVPWLRRAMGWIAWAHQPRAILAATLAGLVVLLLRRDPRGALLLLATVGGGTTLNHLLKHSLQRPRPGIDALVGAPTDFAFPSGHVAGATLLYGVAAVLLLRAVRSPRARKAIAAGAVACVALVAASRLVLGAHYPTDVVAAAVLGAGWLALCVAAVGRPRARREPTGGPHAERGDGSRPEPTGESPPRSR